ncbi:pilin, partial [Patescibacteria group bacterium]|nr:pilin [Patescibacteria group bacterium]
NCKSCTAVCSQLAASGQLKDAKPDFFNLPFNASGCTESLSDYEGTSAVARGGDYDVKQRVAEHQDMFCFTQAECALAAGDPGNFKPGHGCPNKGNEPRGYCRAPDPNIQLQNPIAGVKTIKDLRSFIALMFNVAMGLIIITAAIFFVWGGFKYMLSGVTKEIQTAKETMVNSVIGMVLGLSAYAILANVAPNTINLQTFDIDMINKLNFYNVVYCRDIVPTPKFADAGPPTEPKPFSTTNASGFPLTIDKTKCGTEYFIEGSDSQAVCMGQSCEDGGMCIACSAGLASGCKTTSAHEYRCSDCKIGGNVVAQERWKPDTVWYFLFCDKGSGDDYDIKLESMAEFEFHLSDDSKTSSSGSSGYVTAVCVSDKKGPGKAAFKMTVPEVRNFFDVQCKDMTGPTSNRGMLMLAFIDQEITTDISGVEAALDNKSDIMTGLNCGLGVGGPPLCALSLLYSSQQDNFYFPMNKNMCNTNIFQTSVPFNQQLMRAIAGSEKNTMRDIMRTMYKSKTDDKDIYKDIVSQAWTPEETVKLIEQGMSQSCGFSASHSGETTKLIAE